MSLRLDGCCVTYLDDGARVSALEDLSLDVPDGRVVLLTGPSGCGKSTVLRCVNGLVPAFHEARLTGGVEVDGRPVAEMTLSGLAAAVGTVFQDPRSEFFTFDVTSELAFPCENLGWEGGSIRRRLGEVAERVGITGLLGRRLARLSSGEKQKVAIAVALMPGPRTLLFDEPSANLDDEGLAMLRDLLARLKAEGVSALVADHRLAYLDGVMDRCAILDGGRLVDDVGAQELRERAPAWFAERGLRQLSPTGPDDRARRSAGPVGRADHADADHADRAAPGLRIAGAAVALPGRGPLWRIDDLALPERGVIGVTGANGSGKTTLARLVLGLLRCRGARLEIDGRRRRRRARRRRCAYVMQDVDYQLVAESVLAELLDASAPSAQGRERAEALLERVGLTGLADRHPLTLSGGQKQRLGIALACMKRARVVCLDEPTSGLDAAGMRRVAALLREMADDGALVLVITHDHELADLAFDHVIHLRNGRADLRPHHQKEH